jgi:polysaccharide pyruvyl transferase WcaK-like protein
MEQMNSGELKVGRLQTPRRPIRRIGLLSPTSGNLGNAAMQAAMLANLRKRIVGVEFLGITLNPDETRRRHGIDAFPLAGVSRAYYGLFNSTSSKVGQRLFRKRERTRRWLREIPVAGSVLRAIRTCGAELRHIVAAACVVRRLDRVIVPGGGALDDFWGGPWGQPWALFKWSVLSRLCGVPFLFVSIGKCSLESSLSRFFVRIALRLAAYRSYRDPGSQIAAQGLIDAPDDRVFPDLGFSYPTPVIDASRDGATGDSRLLVGVSPIAYCDPRAWPHKDERRYAAYVGQLAEMVKWLVKGRYRILFFTTDACDSATVDDVRALILGSGIDADTIRILPASTEQDPDTLLKGMSDVDVTIASRLHGIILSHLNATPVLALSFDPKVDAHMNGIGQGDYCLSIDHLRLEALIERFTALEAARKREQCRLRSAGVRFRQLLDVQYDQIVFAPHFNHVTGYEQNHIQGRSGVNVGRYRTK